MSMSTTPHDVSSLGNALRLTKFNRTFNYDLATTDFDNKDFHEVNHLPPFYNDDFMFVLPLVVSSVPSAYGRFMDDMDKMCNEHPWCTTKTTNIQNILVSPLDGLVVLVI